MVITFDGPSASGKSTVAQKVADTLGFYYLNTGFLYRALTYVLTYVYGLSQDQLLDLSQAQLDAVNFFSRLHYSYAPATGVVITYDDQVITPYLKDAAIDQLVSLISPQAVVRITMAALQRKIAHNHSCVAEGRDVGTVVFPHATYKFYITASLEVRAQRWQEMQKKFGYHFSLQEAQKEVAARDYKDQCRAHSPLKKPEGAYEIDTSNKTIEQVVVEVVAIIKKGETSSPL